MREFHGLRIATDMGLRVWIVHSGLATEIAVMLDIDSATSPHRMAQLLARLPACQSLRQHMLVLQPERGDVRQMRLW